MAGLDTAGIGQAIGLAQGQALKIIGGIPILKNAGGSTLEGLKLPKHLDVGKVGGLLRQVMSGGIGSVLQNPLGAVTGQLNGAINGAIGQVTGALGGAASSLTSALGGLNASVGSLSALAGNLSGVTSLVGLPNNFDLYGHIGLAQSFGDAIPPGLGIDTVIGPLTMAADIGAMVDRVAAIATAVTSGTMPVPDAVSAIAGMAATADAAVAGATDAIATLTAAGPGMMAAQAAVASLIPGTLPPAAAIAMRACIRPDMRDAVDGILADHIATILADGAATAATGGDAPAG